ncbi:trp operon leader peptide [Streptomyces cellulosae]|uniref:trp operon leader peptide n=1 Tax=Streptomyces TaxID=1883 RepID=UPI000D0AA2DA|nr:trp operon leader peptide [Streptomyces sp. Akac8]
MSPVRRRSENQRSRSRAPQYAVTSGAFGLAHPVRRLRPASRTGPDPPSPPGGGGSDLGNDAEAHASRLSSCSVLSMFAHSTRTWWWTAHPAAH